MKILKKEEFQIAIHKIKLIKKRIKAKEAHKNLIEVVKVAVRMAPKKAKDQVEVLRGSMPHMMILDFRLSR